LIDWRRFALLPSLLAASCAVSVVDLRDTLDLNQATFQDKLATQEGLADEFLACTTRAYDERVSVPADRPVPEGDARRDGALQAIHTLVTRVKEARPSDADSLRIIEDTLADWTRTSYRRLDLGKLRKVVDAIKQWHIHFDFDEDALAEDGSRFAQLLLAYNMAYFGDIRYTPGPRTGSQPQAVARVTSDGFIDRNGNVWRFPGLSLDVIEQPGQPPTTESSRVDSQRITADLTRVFLEAFFDAAFREPAVGNATALRVQWKPPSLAYPAFDGNHPPIPLEDFARVTRDALRAEAAVTSEVGKAIRGGNLFSLENETLAAGLEAAAGVIAKKLVEHGGFCYFQTIRQSERRKEGVNE
jgi:hypothetical protein